MPPNKRRGNRGTLCVTEEEKNNSYCGILSRNRIISIIQIQSADPLVDGTAGERANTVLWASLSINVIQIQCKYYTYMIQIQHINKYKQHCEFSDLSLMESIPRMTNQRVLILANTVWRHECDLRSLTLGTEKRDWKTPRKS